MRNPTACLLVALFASTAQAQSLELVLPAQARAGTIVEVRVNAKDVHDKLPIKWVFPDAKLPSDGELKPLTFAENCQVLENGRRLLFAWPQAGDFPLTARAFVAIRDGDDVIGFDEITATGTLKLGGAVAGPDEPLVIPPITDDQVSAAVAPISQLLAGQREMAAELSRAWWALGTISQRGGIKTTPALARANAEVARIITQGRFVGRVPGLAPALEQLFTAAVGKDNRALEHAQQQRLAALFFGLAKVASEAR